MPGHSVGESWLQQTLDTIVQLKELIKQNDVIFLLMDSRESRWLPTLLASVHQKVSKTPFIFYFIVFINYFRL